MFTRLALLCAVLIGATLISAPVALAQPGDAALALRWAPVHYQDTDSSDADADYLSTVDFDGDWNAQNNWEAQDDSVARLIGSAYFSVVETSTHWFIVYSYYHGTVVMQSFGGASHPTTRQEAKGHGCFAGNGGAFPGNDGVVYFPSGTGEVPSEPVSWRIGAGAACERPIGSISACPSSAVTVSPASTERGPTSTRVNWTQRRSC